MKPSPQEAAKIAAIANMGMKASVPPPGGIPKPSEQKGALVQYVEEACASRKLYDFDLQGFTTLGGRPVPKYKCRVVTKSEGNKAIVGATAYVEKCCAGTELAKTDPDMITDAKTTFVLWEACRDYDNPMLPAFVSPTWMMDNMTAEQVAILFNNYALCVAKEAVMVSHLSDEMVESLSYGCVALAGTELPGVVLSNMTRETLVDFAIRQALMIAELKLELQDVQDRSGHIGPSEEGSGGEASPEETADGDGSSDEGRGEHAQGGENVSESDV